MKRTILLFLIFIFISCTEETIKPDENFSSIQGHVTDNISGSVISGAKVKSLTNSKSDTTNTQGYFLIEDLTSGLNNFVIKAPYYDSLTTTVNLEEGLNTKDFLLDRAEWLKCEPLVDTSRSYFVVVEDSSYEIDLFPSQLYVRYAPNITDTTGIDSLIAEYSLIKLSPTIFRDQQWTAHYIIPDSFRAECFFTPYGIGKTGFFGSEPIVEYAFGVFDGGLIYPTGRLGISFFNSATQSQIDSLHASHGLRFIYTMYGKHYSIVTPNSEQNVLDLAFTLRNESIIEEVLVSIAFKANL